MQDKTQNKPVTLLITELSQSLLFTSRFALVLF